MPKSRNRPRRKRRLTKDSLPLASMFDQITYDREGAPPILYHYTTWAGAHGILTSQQFWATAHDCTNDEAELVTADSIIIEVAKDLLKNATGIVAKVLDEFLARYASLQITKSITVCLVCFSVARDDSEQWRKYGDDGLGLCLGVRVLNEPPPAGPPGAMMKVDYSEPSWRGLVGRDFQKVCSILSGAADVLQFRALGVSALNRIAALASMIAKRPEWAGEQEFRQLKLISKDARIQLKERESAGKMIQYLPISVRKAGKRIALSEIIIGSNRNAEETRELLKRLLADNGYEAGSIECPEITISSIPPLNRAK